MRLATVAAVLLFALGCGDGRPKMVPAAGKVTLNGQPVVGGSLTFHPELGALEKGDRPSCQLQADGSFTAQTYPYGDGAVPGVYKVTLDPALAGRIKKPLYADPAKTPLRIDIPASGITGHLFEIK